MRKKRGCFKLKRPTLEVMLEDLRGKDNTVDLDAGHDMPVKRTGLGPRTSFGGVKNPELDGKNGPTFKGANSSNSSCWKDFKKCGTKPSPTRPGVTVNNCIPKNQKCK